MYVPLQCLFLTVITSIVFCRPERGIHNPLPTSRNSDVESSTSPIHRSELTTGSDDSFQSLAITESFEDPEETPSIVQPKEVEEDTRTLPIHNLESNHFGTDQSSRSKVTFSSQDDSKIPITPSYRTETDEVKSEESSLYLDPSKDSEESPESADPLSTPKEDPILHPLDSNIDSESDESYREALIKDLKSRILQKLNLPSPPSNVSPFDLSPDVLLLMHREEDDSQSREEENLIVHPSNSDFTSCSITSSCRKIEFNISSDQKSVLSVQAWVNKLSSGRLTLSVYSASEVVATIKEDLRKVISEAGWAMFELPTMSLIESKEGGLQCIIETEGDINTEGASSPFLVVRKYIKTQEKKKRNARTTNENCSCCTENHYITIKDLGWQNWVISPPGFNVKTCAGQCEENRSSFTINYQRIISTLYKINKTIPKPKCNFWAPSCKPDSYLPQRIMYLYDNGTVHDHLLPDMLIASCRCL